MPIPLGLLIAGGAGAAQAISPLVKTKAEKRNEQELERLLDLQARGQLGLSAKEQQLRQQQYVSPVKSAAMQAQERAEAVAAGAGQASAADLSRLRTETTREIAEGAQQAQMRMLEEDVQRQAQQRAEIEQRMAAEEARGLERRRGVLEGVGQIAGAAGALAGQVPETMRMYGEFGAPLRDPQALKDFMEAEGYSPDTIEAISAIKPGRFKRVMVDAMQGNPEMQQSILRQIEANPKQFSDRYGLAGETMVDLVENMKSRRMQTNAPAEIFQVLDDPVVANSLAAAGLDDLAMRVYAGSDPAASRQLRRAMQRDPQFDGRIDEIIRALE